MPKILIFAFAVHLLFFSVSSAKDKKEQESAKSGIIKVQAKQDLQDKGAQDSASAQGGDEKALAKETDQEVNNKQVPSPYPAPQLAPPLSREATPPAF